MSLTRKIVPIIRDEERDVVICDGCTGEATLGRYSTVNNHLPEWIEISFYDPQTEEYLEKHFCGFSCLMDWGKARETAINTERSA